MDNSQKRFLYGGIAAASVVSGVVATYRLLRHRHADPVVAIQARVMSQCLQDEVERWTPTDVMQWLVEVDASQEARNAFSENGVDGAVLLELQDQHLSDMGIKKVGDRIKIEKGVRRFLGKPSHAPSPQRARADAAEPEQQQAVEAPITKLEQDRDNIQVQLTSMIVSRMRTMYEALNSEQFLQAPLDQQRSFVAAAQHNVATVTEAMKQLPEDRRIELVPLINGLKDTLENISTALENAHNREAAPQTQPAPAVQSQPRAPEQPKAEGAPTGRDEREEAAQLASVLRNVHSILKSHELLEAPEETRKEMLGAITKQLDAASSVASRLSLPEQRNAIMQLCGALQNVVKEIQSAFEEQEKVKTSRPEKSTPIAAATTTTETKVQPASMQFLLQRLHGVFTNVKNVTQSNTPQPQKRQALEQARSDVESLRTEGQALPDEERGTVEQTANGVLRVIDQVANVLFASSQAKSSQESAAKAEKSVKAVTAPAATATRAEPKRAFEQVVGRLRDMLTVLKSDQFSRAAPETQQRLLADMSKDLPEIQKQVEQLPTRERSAITPLMLQIRELVNVRARLYAEAGERLAKEEKNIRSEQASKSSATQQDAEVPEEEGEPNLASEQQKAAGFVATQLQQILRIINSGGFLNAPREEQKKIAVALQSQLGQLREICDALTEEQKNSLAPIIEQLSRVTKHVTEPRKGVEEVEEDEEEEDKKESKPKAEEKEGEEEEEPSDGEEEKGADEEEPSEEDRRRTFADAAKATQVLQGMKEPTKHDLEQFEKLLDRLDRCGVSSSQEVSIRQSFQRALKNALQIAMQKSEPNKPEPATAEDADLAAIKGDRRLMRLMATLVALRRELNEGNYATTADVMPYFSILTETLADADKEQLPWKDNKRVADLVDELRRDLAAILRTLQQRESEPQREKSESNIASILASATADLNNGVATSIEELGPYIHLLEECEKMQEGLTSQDCDAMQELQQAIIDAQRKIESDKKAKEKPQPSPQKPQQSPQKAPQKEQKAASPAAAGGSPHAQATPAKRDVSPAAVSATPGSCKSTLRAPPNTPATETRAAAAAAKPQEEAAENEGDENEDEDAGEEERPEHGEAQPDPAKHSPSVSSDINRLRQQAAEIKRDSIKQLHSIISHPMFARLQEAQQVDTLNRAQELLQSLSDYDLNYLRADAHELATAMKAHLSPPSAVQGGIMNELGLLPRLVERLRNENFLQETSLFELQCIARILARLNEAEEVQQQEEFWNIVRMAKQLFAVRVASADTTQLKNVNELQSPLMLTGLHSEDEDGCAVERYLLYSPEEQEEQKPNEAILQRFACSPKPIAAPKDEALDEWVGGSEALIVYVPAYPQGTTSENETGLSEVAMLYDTLSNDHAFNVTCMTTDVTMQGVTEAIHEAASGKPKRLLVFLHTPAPTGTFPQHALSLPSGGALTHKAILEAANGAEHTIVAHDSRTTFEVVSATADGKSSPHVGVTLTEGAVAVSNTSRCWLYDGLFTPILLALLIQLKAPLCAEDLVNNVVRVLTAKEFDEGCYLSDAALAAPFFVPFAEESDDNAVEAKDQPQPQAEAKEVAAPAPDKPKSPQPAKSASPQARAKADEPTEAPKDAPKEAPKEDGASAEAAKKDAQTSS